MHPFVRSGLTGGLFPDNFAGVAVEAEDVELVDVARAAVATTEPRPPPGPPCPPGPPVRRDRAVLA